MDPPSSPRDPSGLASRPSFRLGELRVVPAHLRVERAGAGEVLEPRVMQVLVALSDAGGQVVTRQQLVDRCWAGRVVGDNAIHRATSRLRRLARTIGAGCFELKTIGRVGYSLVPAGGAEGTASAEPMAAPVPAEAPAAAGAAIVGPPVGRRPVLAATITLAAMAAVGVGAAALGRRPREAAPAVDDLLRRVTFFRRQGNWNDTLEAIEYARRATQADPRSAAAWGASALAGVDRYFDVTGSESATIAAQVDDAAERALALDPDNGDAQLARLQLRSSTAGWSAFEAACRDLHRRHPDNADIAHALGRVHCELGRWAAALPVFEALLSRDPLFPEAQKFRATALWSAGRAADADAASARALALLPGSGTAWETRFTFLATTGRTDAAMALVRTDRDVGGIELPIGSQTARVLARALTSRHPGDVSAAIQAVVADRRSGQLFSGTAIQYTAALGDLDLAFEIAQRFYFGAASAGTRALPPPTTSFLFTPPARTMRSDTRFAGLTMALGLDAQWMRPGAGPDFRRRAG